MMASSSAMSNSDGLGTDLFAFSARLLEAVAALAPSRPMSSVSNPPDTKPKKPVHQSKGSEDREDSGSDTEYVEEKNFVVCTWPTDEKEETKPSLASHCCV